MEFKFFLKQKTIYNLNYKLFTCHDGLLVGVGGGGQSAGQGGGDGGDAKHAAESVSEEIISSDD